ncbi:MAG: hypothetical protein Pars2KO_32810 [Parasphingorhabdus sp.]
MAVAHVQGSPKGDGALCLRRVLYARLWTGLLPHNPKEAFSMDKETRTKWLVYVLAIFIGGMLVLGWVGWIIAWWVE